MTDPLLLLVGRYRLTKLPKDLARVKRMIKKYRREERWEEEKLHYLDLYVDTIKDLPDVVTEGEDDGKPD